MNDVYRRAELIKAELIENRRRIHQFGGTGFDIPETVKFVKEKLVSYGYEPVELCKSGITCTVGSGGKCILLRGDMDALPIREESGEPFACKNGTMHACSHDMHTAMLLGAARILKERESELKGTVKFMFQPAEEILSGANEMIKAGILEHPKVDAAMAMHVAVGSPRKERKLGAVKYSVGNCSHSADEFEITVTVPKGMRGINPLSILTRITLGIQELPAVEFPAHHMVDVRCGVLRVGKAGNTPGESGILKGVARTAEGETRDRLKMRIEEIAKGIAGGFHSEAAIEWVRGVPPMYNDPTLCEELSGYCAEVVGQEKIYAVPAGGGGEDFSAISEKVPSMFFDLGCGNEEDGYVYPNHSPKFRVNEDALPIGAALHAVCAMNWVNNHAEKKEEVLR